MRKCKACPFNDGLTVEACMGQNYGCLPSSSDMISHFDQHNEAISCHENGNIPCRGLSEVRQTQKTTILKYEKWYNGN